ncbi:metallopeptidase family protein [Pseudonocardia spinosispora]|uniref:metallopeptidase family protein n=1 Tax=Pseudonocardia spinosispora TaxID=103441 RepID=UPI0009FDEB1F|nr:metallopeptidase family protein [Pseudonocardia spinosispora]
MRSVRNRPRRRATHRDRRGRGLRGLRYPVTTPVFKNRAQRFDDMVLEALEPIEHRWGDELTELDLAVDMVPEIEQTDPDATSWPPEVVEDLGVPLAQLVPAGVDSRGMPTRARIVLYRRPLEARSRDGIDLVDLLHEVLIEQVACYLGVEPDSLETGE